VKVTLNGPLVVTVVSWGFNFVAVKILYSEMSAPAVALSRWVVMTALLAIICRLRGESLRPQKGDALRILGVGFIAMGVYMVLFMEGMRGTNPAEGAIILATAPIFTYILSCFVRHEPFSGPALLGSFVAFLGVTVVILGGSASGHGTAIGNLLILISAVVWAGGAVMMKPLLGRYSPTQVLTMSMPGGLPVLLPYALPATLATHFERVSTYGWTMFASVAIMSGVVAFVCFYEGVRKIGASGAALYQYFVPILATFFAWVVMGRPPTPVQFAGLAVVLGGVFYAGRARAAARRLAAAAA